MKLQGSMVTGMGVGAGLMYLLDPQYGKRRRALFRDKAIHLAHATSGMAGKTSRDLSNRTRGLTRSTTGLLRRDQVSDAVLRERVRSKLGRCVANPSAIEVECRDGMCTLSGPIHDYEVDRLLSSVARVRGVQDVVDRLEPHAPEENVSGLQARRQVPSDFDLLQENWAPATRVLVGMTGGALVGAAIVRRQPLAAVAGVLGTAMLARSITNRPLRRLAGQERPTRAIDLVKTVTVHAPVERVYELWSHPEEFPRFMEHLTEVQPLGEDRYRWCAKGPGGIGVEWEAVVTERQPDRRISWRSVDGSTIGTEGTVNFEPVGDGTRIHIQMSYNPPAGALGHAVASVFRDDPRHALDEDMVRLKSLLENGKTRAHGEQVQLSDVAPGH